MASKSNKKRRMGIFLVGKKYFTRVRWGNDNTSRGDVKFPLETNKKSIAEHRRDTIQDTSLRGKIIRAYEENGPNGVKRIKAEIDWFKKDGTLVDASMTLIQAIEEYSQYLKSQRLNKNTIDIYLRTLNEFTCSLNVTFVNKIKPKHFTDFKNSMPELSIHTVNRKLRSLQTFFNWMYDEEHIKKPIRIKKISTVQQPVRFFSNGEFELILKNVSKVFSNSKSKVKDDEIELFVDALKLYRDTGMRLSEPFDGKLKKLGYSLQITGSTTKNSYPRNVYLTEQQVMIVIQMNEWLNNRLKTRKNRYESIKVFSRVFARALKKSKLNGKLHDLRKTFASRLWFLTGQEFALCHALGHTDTSMTKQYTSLDKVELARAFPDIVIMKKDVNNVKTPLRGHKQGDIEQYSNFGFMYQ